MARPLARAPPRLRNRPDLPHSNDIRIRNRRRHPAGRWISSANGRAKNGRGEAHAGTSRMPIACLIITRCRSERAPVHAPIVPIARMGVGMHPNRSNTMLHVVKSSRPVHRNVYAVAIVAIVLSAAMHLVSVPLASVRATGPCDGIAGDPGDPIGPGQPDIAGQIVTAGTNTPIVGVTVRLYVCDGATPAFVASAATSGDGAYAFADLNGPAWYYVQAVLTGPLSGMTPAAGTSNPTTLIDVGAGASGVDLAFQ